MQMISNRSEADLIIIDQALSSIKRTHVTMQNLHSAPATPAVLALQIDLCEVLLNEISGIRNRLAKGIVARCPNAALRMSGRGPVGLIWPEHLHPGLGDAEFDGLSASGLTPFICASCPRPCL